MNLTHLLDLDFIPEHYHLQLKGNSKKMAQKKQMLFLAALGKTGLSHDIFFKFSVGPFELFEVESQKKLNFEI